jgi:hypothetical protein
MIFATGPLTVGSADEPGVIGVVPTPAPPVVGPVGAVGVGGGGAGGETLAPPAGGLPPFAASADGAAVSANTAMLDAMVVNTRKSFSFVGRRG